MTTNSKLTQISNCILNHKNRKEESEIEKLAKQWMKKVGILPDPDVVEAFVAGYQMANSQQSDCIGTAFIKDSQ